MKTNTGNTLSRKESENSNNSRNNSLQRKKNHHHNQSSQSHNNSLRRGPYVSCSELDLDCEPSDPVKNTKIFPKEHYKVSRKHSRKRNSMVDG